MSIYAIVILFFIVLETMNIILLYFVPQSTKGNAVGIFKAFEESKNHPEIHELVKYLINWVAGIKLIFVALLIVIVTLGDSRTQVMSLVALIISTSTFFWRLYPLIKSMDKRGQLSIKGYSKTLAIMIASFLTVFVLTLAYYLFAN